MKMTKLILVAAATLFTLFGQAHAAGTAVDGTPISNVDDCTLLTAAVTVRLSTSVHAAYDCDDPAEATLFFGTCHESGSRSDRSYTCAAADVAAGSGHDCEGQAVDTVVTLTGRAAFLGSSEGGVISGLNLDADACSDASIVARVGAYATGILAAQ